jgi:hypothetical protein
MSAFLGLALWIVATVYILTVISSGFVSFTAPNVYVTLVAVISGLIVNSVLVGQSDRLTRRARLSLFLISAVLSLLVISAIAYMALDLGNAA